MSLKRKFSHVTEDDDNGEAESPPGSGETSDAVSRPSPTVSLPS